MSVANGAVHALNFQLECRAGSYVAHLHNDADLKRAKQVVKKWRTLVPGATYRATYQTGAPVALTWEDVARIFDIAVSSRAPKAIPVRKPVRVTRPPKVATRQTAPAPVVDVATSRATARSMLMQRGHRVLQCGGSLECVWCGGSWGVGSDGVLGGSGGEAKCPGAAS